MTAVGLHILLIWNDSLLWSSEPWIIPLPAAMRLGLFITSIVDARGGCGWCAWMVRADGEKQDKKVDAEETEAEDEGTAITKACFWRGLV